MQCYFENLEQEKVKEKEDVESRMINRIMKSTGFNESSPSWKLSYGECLHSLDLPVMCQCDQYLLWSHNGATYCWISELTSETGTVRTACGLVPVPGSHRPLPFIATSETKPPGYLRPKIQSRHLNSSLYTHVRSVHLMSHSQHNNKQTSETQNAMDDDSRWATVAPPEHVDTCCVREVLDANHQTAFATAMSNLLSTEIAEQTFAQIIDGLPLRDVAFSMRFHKHTWMDPIFAHVELCPGVLERTRMLRNAFDPRAMEMRTDVRITESIITNEIH